MHFFDLHFRDWQTNVFKRKFNFNALLKMYLFDNLISIRLNKRFTPKKIFSPYIYRKSWVK